MGKPLIQRAKGEIERHALESGVSISNGTISVNDFDLLKRNVSESESLDEELRTRMLSGLNNLENGVKNFSYADMMETIKLARDLEKICKATIKKNITPAFRKSNRKLIKALDAVFDSHEKVLGSVNAFVIDNRRNLPVYASDSISPSPGFSTGTVFALTLAGAFSLSLKDLPLGLGAIPIAGMAKGGSRATGGDIVEALYDVLLIVWGIAIFLYLAIGLIEVFHRSIPLLIAQICFVFYGISAVWRKIENATERKLNKLKKKVADLSEKNEKLEEELRRHTDEVSKTQ